MAFAAVVIPNRTLEDNNTEIQFCSENVLDKRGVMREINVKLWRNHHEQNWSVEINGDRYDHVEIGVIEELVERALIVSEADLMQAKTQLLH